ncbi:hypothetical protein KFL_002070125 [Klebsormidium nitens]|uniref:Uncharacterized protein n=1 Tax=Klebsormidium nitens TaxID=105231 RepID=A0A1Y1I7Z0_KLENI|nr:hypothetical protein KFL_002070125 [Klebsormidium nitens]|eukprot:GAQ84817.1 hypothetical protein KFL_002070125 [Klebsormidium nitens]
MPGRNDEYLVQPQTIGRDSATWSFPGGGRLILSLDLKDGTCNVVPEHVPADASFIKDAWTASSEWRGSNSTHNFDLIYKLDTGFVKLKEKDALPDPYILTITPDAARERYEHIGERIPSALVLYRLLCLFPSLDVPTYDWYKCLWDFLLTHEATGFRLKIWEHKAALHAMVFWTDTPGPAPECFQADACAFLELLLSDECRHPCGVVAGSIDPAVLDNSTAAALEPRRYMVDPSQIVRDRLTPDDVVAARAVRDKWKALEEPDSAPQDGTGRLDVRFGPAATTIILPDFGQELTAPANKRLKAETDPSTVPFCVTISSALLLYRLLGLFSLLDRETRYSNVLHYSSVQTPVEIIRPGFTDSVWHTEVRHMASASVVRFGDYRGAAAVWAATSAGADHEEKLKEDLVSLLELLCGDKCPHTYDEVVAGCIA